MLPEPIFEQRVRYPDGNDRAAVAEEGGGLEPGVVAVPINLGLNPGQNPVPNIRCHLRGQPKKRRIQTDKSINLSKTTRFSTVFSTVVENLDRKPNDEKTTGAERLRGTDKCNTGEGVLSSHYAASLTLRPAAA